MVNLDCPACIKGYSPLFYDIQRTGLLSINERTCFSVHFVTAGRTTHLASTRYANNLISNNDDCFGKDIPYESCLLDDMTVNLDWLESTLFSHTSSSSSSAEKNDDVEGSRNYFTDCVMKLSPLFAAVYYRYKELTVAEFAERLKVFCIWTGQTELLSRCFEILRHDDEGDDLTSSCHATLLLTPVMERALGDLLMMKTGPIPPPSLLRDLLLMPQLTELLSPALIRLLRVLIGPPTSLNLRNLAWHGFLGAEQLHLQYPYSLLCAVVSIGALLAEHGITEVPHRTFITPHIPQYFPDFCEPLSESLLGVFDTTRFVTPSMRSFWHLAIRLYQEERYGESISIVLPLLESSLRRLYVSVNRCPQRLLTAEDAAFFTTFEEILSQSVGCDVNQLRTVIGDSYLSMLLDILVYPLGPRVRDRVGHGEVCLALVPRSLTHHIISLCLSLALRFLPNHHTAMVTLDRDTTAQSGHGVAEWLWREVECLSTNYESLYHPISVVKQRILPLVLSLATWPKLQLCEATFSEFPSSPSTMSRSLVDTSSTDSLSTDLSLTNHSTDSSATDPLPFTEDHYSSSSQSTTAVKSFAGPSILATPSNDKVVSGDRSETVRSALSSLHRLFLLEKNEQVQELCMWVFDGSNALSIVKIIEEQLLSIRPVTCYRYSNNNALDREEELVHQLLRLTSLCAAVSVNMSTVATQRHDQLLRKELRSRQRLTYMRMIHAMDAVCLFLRLVVFVLISALHNISTSRTNKNTSMESFEEGRRRKDNPTTGQLQEGRDQAMDQSNQDTSKIQSQLIRYMRRLEVCCEKLPKCVAESRWDNATALSKDILTYTASL